MADESPKSWPIAPKADLALTDSILMNRGEDGATPGAGDPRRALLKDVAQFFKMRLPELVNVDRYVRTPPVTVTFTLGSPGQVNWTAHGLQVNDPVVFALPRDKGVCTITIASPGVVTKNGHGLANDDPVMLSTTGAVPTGLSLGNYYGGTTLYARNVTTNTFELSATAGGASINTTGSQSGSHRVMRNSSMPAGLANATVYYVKTVIDPDHFTVSATPGGAAINLTGVNAVGKVRAQTGNDANDGTANDRAHAWLTFERALIYRTEVVKGPTAYLNFNFAEGEYAGGYNVWDMHSPDVGFAIFKAVNSTAYNANTIVFGPWPFYVQDWAFCYIDGFSILATGYSSCVYSSYYSWVEMTGCELIASQFCWLGSFTFSVIAHYTDVWCVCDGGLDSAFSAEAYSQMYVANNGQKIYVETANNGSPPAFASGFVAAYNQSMVWNPGAAGSIVGSATGKRFHSQEWSIIKQSGEDSLSHFPGDAPGDAVGESVVTGLGGATILSDLKVSTYAGRLTSPPEGRRAVFTDSDTAGIGSIIAGGGSNRVEGRFDGTYWRVSAASIAGLEVLQANRTYYVRTDGSDANDGLANTAGGAFLTVQACFSRIHDTVDFHGYTVTIQIGDGTYYPAAGANVLRIDDAWRGGGTLLVIGNAGNKDAVILKSDSDVILINANPGTVKIQYVQMQQTNGFAESVAALAGYTEVTNVTSAGTPYNHFLCGGYGAGLDLKGTNHVSGSAANAILASWTGANLRSVFGSTLALVGAITAPYFMYATNRGTVAWPLATLTGSFSGKRFYAANGGLVEEFYNGGSIVPGVGEDLLPGGTYHYQNFSTGEDKYYPAYGVQGVSKTSAYNVRTTDVGYNFDNAGCTARQDFQLPPAARNLEYTFICMDADGIRVIAGTGNSIRIGATESATAGRIDSTDIGSVVTLTALDTSHWVAKHSIGTWTVT